MCTSYLPVIIYTHCHSQTCCTTKYYLTKCQGMYGFSRTLRNVHFLIYFFPNHKFRYKLSYLLVWPLPFHSGWHVQLRSDPGSFSTVKCDQEQGCILTRIELQQEQTRLQLIFSNKSWSIEKFKHMYSSEKHVFSGLNAKKHQIHATINHSFFFSLYIEVLCKWYDR